MRSPSVSGRIIFVAIFSTLFLLGSRSIVPLVICLVVGSYLAKTNRRLLVLGLAVCLGCFLSVWIRGDLALKEDRVLEGVVVEVGEKALTVRSGLQRYLVYVDHARDYALGDIITADITGATISSKAMPHAFSYEGYLRSLGIHKLSRGENVKVSGRKFVLAKIPNALREYVDSQFTSPVREYVGMFVLGDSTKLEAGMEEQSTRLGIRHLFALSGMHLGIITGFLGAVLKRLYIAKGTKNTFIALFLALYNLLTGFRVSLLRASLVLVSFFVINGDRMRLSRLDCLSLVYLGMLAYNPYYLDSLGFILTFSMSFALLLGRNLIKHQNRLLALIRTALLLNVIMLPILLEASGGIGIMFLAANVVFITFVGAAMLPLAFATFMFPFIGGVYSGVIGIFEAMVVFLEDFNLFIRFNLEGEAAKAFYFLGVLAPLCFPKIKMALLTGALMITVAFSLSFVRIAGCERVQLFAIGQGDSILIEDGGAVILIDTGPEDEYDTLINCLIKENITKIDLLVISHWHSDHDGEFADIIERLEVTTIVAPSIPDQYKGLGIITPRAFDRIECGGRSFLVLNSDNGDSNENNNSLVLHTKIGSDWWLFMGDAETEVEADLIGLDLEVDIVKVGHHGSSTASSATFVEWCSPRYALISAGRNNYGFPDEEVRSRWASVGTVYVTLERGTISFSYNPLFPTGRVSFYKPDHPLLWRDLTQSAEAVFTNRQRCGKINQGDEIGTKLVSCLGRRRLHDEKGDRRYFEHPQNR